METESGPKFNPKIIAFCCEQSGIPAVEMAKSSQLELPANLEVIPVPCAGRIETVFLLKALASGADGVMVLACHEENCQYLRGNIRAKSRLLHARDRLARIGLEKERLEVFNLAANSSKKLVDAVKDKVDQLRKLGPNPFSRGH